MAAICSEGNREPAATVPGTEDISSIVYTLAGCLCAKGDLRIGIIHFIQHDATADRIFPAQLLDRFSVWEIHRMASFASFSASSS
jgi:hypothetical protein